MGCIIKIEDIECISQNTTIQHYKISIKLEVVIFLKMDFSKIWTLDFLKVHNCAICSSVVMEKDILDKINNFKNMKPPGEDYDCWRRALQHTDSVYLTEVCFYYDAGHGKGRNY